MPQIPNPKPNTPCPKPQASKSNPLKAKTQTSNPKPYTPDSKPQTLQPDPRTPVTSLHPRTRGRRPPLGAQWIASLTAETLFLDTVDLSTRPMAPMPSQWLQRVPSPHRLVLALGWIPSCSTPKILHFYDFPIR